MNMVVLLPVSIQLLLFWLPLRAFAKTSSESGANNDLDWEKLVQEGNWASLSPHYQYARLATESRWNDATDQALNRFLQQTSTSSNNPYSNYLSAGTGFEYSTDAEYEQYQLAWRYLGLAIDCSIKGSDRGGSRDDYDDDDTCARILLYAVYVDFDYNDNQGLGQYQFYDRHYDTWAGCQEQAYYSHNDQGRDLASRDNGGNRQDRCVKMDCHLSDTHYTLLGVFKALQPTEWLEQLFKHEGICIWTSQEYKMAQIVRRSLPEKCTAIGYVGNDHKSGDKQQNYYAKEVTVGAGLYFHIKPEMGGNIGLGLYSDSACSSEYSGSLTMAKIIQSNYDMCDTYYNYNTSGYYYSDWMEECGKNNPAILYRFLNDFNDAMNIYKQCQSCVAYSLNSNDFQCYDDAGYTNCMQCMKFKEKANSLPAYASDLVLASRQVSILEITVGNARYGYGGYTSRGNWNSKSDFAYSAEADRLLEAKYAKAEREGGLSGGLFFGLSIAALVCSFLFFVKVKFIDDFDSKQKRKDDKKKPLLFRGKGRLS